MTPSAFSSGNRLLLLIFLIVFCFSAEAQRKAKPMGNSYQNFLDTQWWLGVRFGMNYTQANPTRRLSSFSPINYEGDELKKEYQDFQNIGAQAGMDISFYHKGFSIVFQPSYKQMNFSYQSVRTWEGDAETQRFETKYEIDQFLNFVEVPLTLQYEVFQRGKTRPFVFAGIQYSFLITAGKDTKITHTDYAAGFPNEYSGGGFSYGVKNEFENYYGAVGGIGAAFDYFNVRTVLGISYLYALNPVTNKSVGFQDNELSSLGEASDHFRLNNINASISLVFPLRYIDKTFQPY